jgi:alpha-1,2-mannosyltransferase
MLSFATRPLTLLERWLLGLFVVIVVAFGCLVELRSAFLSRRMGDLGCFLRGGWAVSSGNDLYDVTDDNKWHYNYPPLYAILISPLADPPRGYDTSGYVPYAASVAIVYVFSLLCLILAAHWLASAIEESSADPSWRDQPRYCRRWWALRLWPVLVCLPPVGHTLMRGQVNLQVLAILCAAMACWLRSQNVRAGAWLAFAICIKVIPAYLLVYPLWKRDVRTLTGCALGLFLGLVVVPAVYMGPSEAKVSYERYAKVFFGPLLKLSDDTSRQAEILGVNATDSVGVRNALQNWSHPDRLTRPEEHSSQVTWSYRGLGALMTFLVLWPGTFGRALSAWGRLEQFSALILLMAIFSPVCHSHYLAFCLPTATCLLARSWQNRDDLRLGVGLASLFAIFVVTNVLPSLPDWEILRDRCLALFGTLPLWAASVAQLWKREMDVSATVAEPTRETPRLAA